MHKRTEESPPAGQETESRRLPFMLVAGGMVCAHWVHWQVCLPGLQWLIHEPHREDSKSLHKTSHVILFDQVDPIVELLGRIP